MLIGFAIDRYATEQQETAYDIITAGFTGQHVLQYTGLKDKNGKEIYEGDVLLIPDTFTETVDVGVGSVPVAQWPENHLSEVVFEDGCFKIVIREKGDIWWKVHYNFECVKEETGLEALEVIGNIYENPDLLT
jgi:uncharacterized phage protein (TIGR01671 family)